MPVKTTKADASNVASIDPAQEAEAQAASDAIDAALREAMRKRMYDPQGTADDAKRAADKTTTAATAKVATSVDRATAAAMYDKWVSAKVTKVDVRRCRAHATTGGTLAKELVVLHDAYTDAEEDAILDALIAARLDPTDESPDNVKAIALATALVIRPLHEDDPHWGEEVHVDPETGKYVGNVVLCGDTTARNFFAQVNVAGTCVQRPNVGRIGKTRPWVIGETTREWDDNGDPIAH